MKRSEMLKKISTHLEEECGLDFLVMNPEEIAEEILDLIEKNGMIPFGDLEAEVDECNHTINIKLPTWDEE